MTYITDQDRITIAQNKIETLNHNIIEKRTKMIKLHQDLASGVYDFTLPSYKNKKRQELTKMQQEITEMTRIKNRILKGINLLQNQK